VGSGDRGRRGDRRNPGTRLGYVAHQRLGRSCLRYRRLQSPPADRRRHSAIAEVERGPRDSRCGPHTRRACPRHPRRRLGLLQLPVAARPRQRVPRRQGHRGASAGSSHRQPEAGHTPAKADGLVGALRARGFSDDELVDAGLAHRYPDSDPVSDFYRQPVLIPIRDDQQRVVGIIGRNVGDQQRWAKYKNPPRTTVYDKSVNLYQPLPPPADPQGQVIVVEGTLDAMAIAIAAIRTGRPDLFCPVTQSGRELSDTQVRRIITLHASRPVLGFDGDSAGRDSSARYEQAFCALGRQVLVSTLPAPHDPASWLAVHGDAGLDAWHSDHAVGAGRGLPVRPQGVVPGGARNAKSARVQSPPSRRARYLPGESLAAASGLDDGLVAL